MTPKTKEAVIEAFSFGTPAHEKMDLVKELRHVNGHLSKQFVENVLVRVLREDPNAIVRHEAAFSLGCLHWGEIPLAAASVESLCEAAVNDPSSVVRHEAAEVLGGVSGPGVRKSLERLLGDPDEDVAETARISLARNDVEIGKVG